MTDEAGTATAEKTNYPEGVEINAPISKEYSEILTPEAVSFVAKLHREFNPRRVELLQRRQDVQRQIDDGKLPDFLPETKQIRQGAWSVAPVPHDLQDRRVEITGPTERKMTINALNSGAKVFMGDFEDANAPTWSNMVEGQINVRDVFNRTISFSGPEGKQYRMGEEPAMLMLRPRGWHLPEKHVLIDGKQASGSLFDFGLLAFHNVKSLVGQGTGLYLYLPKLESHLEARLWNDVFTGAEDKLGVPRGSIRATVLIETILAAFEMDEILYELREHSAGLNAGRWDYIFSIIKKFRNHPNFLMPDRVQVAMTTRMMRSYDLLTIKTAHRRDTDAMGGMSAFIPVKTDAEAQKEAIAQVEDDKRREAGDGHDGTWVAHPGLVPVALKIFDEMMPRPNQIDRKRDDDYTTQEDLLTVPEGNITEAGLRLNITVTIRYLESWLNGQGAVAIFNLMEDAATAEISRAQVWQWVHQNATMNDGRQVTKNLVRQLLQDELEKIKEDVGEEAYSSGKYDIAAKLCDEVSLSDDFVDFLTLPAYEYLP
ncbi:MAG: malate synthase A [Chloroflexota bacterium]|nr:MAG: malate synthase A [Chloroflexota bacterium]